MGKIPRHLRTLRPINEAQNLGKTSFLGNNTEALHKFIVKEQSKVEHWEQVEADYGRLVFSGPYGNQFVELFEFGFVRFSRITEQSLGEQARDFFILPKFIEFGPVEKLLSASAADNKTSIEQQGRKISKWASRAISTAGYYLGQDSNSWLEVETDQRVFRVEVPMLLDVYRTTVGGVLKFAAQLGTGNQVGEGIQVDGPTSLALQLQNLSELHQNGVLTDEEFIKAKAKLLSD
jgi:hypothetical protein